MVEFFIVLLVFYDSEMVDVDILGDFL